MGVISAVIKTADKKIGVNTNNFFFIKKPALFSFKQIIGRLIYIYSIIFVILQPLFIGLQTNTSFVIAFNSSAAFSAEASSRNIP